MKTRILSITFGLIFLINALAYAQNTVARLKYEEAEEAYLAKNYQETVTKLNEAEGILKATNPKILYLRIMAGAKIIEQNPDNDYNVLKNTRTAAANYLVQYDNLPNNEDKYRDIYKVAEALKVYPATLEIFEQRKKLLVQAEQDRRDRLELDARISADQSKVEAARAAEKKLKALNFVNGLLDKYKYDADLTEDQFRAFNPEAAILMKKKRHKVNDVILYVETLGGNKKKGAYRIMASNNGIVEFYEIIINDPKAGDVEEVFKTNKALIIASGVEYKESGDKVIFSVPDKKTSVMLIKEPEYSKTVSFYFYSGIHIDRVFGL
jgi:vacuolar-type H+-ATPase subunit I/STV1